MRDVSAASSPGEEGPAMLDLRGIVEEFRAVDPDMVAAARRRFLTMAGLGDSPAGAGAAGADDLLFADWFAFDTTVGGASPFRLVADRLSWSGAVGADVSDDLASIAATNRCSWFWVTAVDGTSHGLDVEDLADGRRYRLTDGPLAVWFDGAHGGSLLGRIASVRGGWRPVDAPLFRTRRASSPAAKLRFRALVRRRGHRFVDLVRLAYGR